MIIIINNDKYDVTEFINEHPGGKDVFIDGADMTAEFNKIIFRLCWLFWIGNNIHRKVPS